MCTLRAYLLVILFPAVCLGYLEPRDITVTKPIPATTYVVGPGETYTTIEAIDGVVGPGDLVQIMAGSYDATNFSASGTSGDEIVLEAYGDGVVYIEVSEDAAATETFVIGGSYLIFDGGPDKSIVIRRKPTDTTYHGLVQIGGDYVTFWRCQFIGPTGPCNDTTNSLMQFGSPTTVYSNSFHPIEPRVINCVLDGGSDSHKGIYVHGAVSGAIWANDFYDITGNSIQLNPRGGHYVEGIDVGWNAIHDGGPCDGSTTWDPHAVLISGMTSAQGDPPWIEDVVIHDNIFWGWAGQHGVSISSGFDSPLQTSTGGNPAVRIFNNTFFGFDLGTLAQYGVRISSSSAQSADGQIIIRNNIFHDISNTPVVGQTGTGVDFTSTNNIENGSPIDPGFVSEDDTLLTFLTLSASLSGYDTNPPVSIDYAGETRDETAPDIGAFEYEATTPAIAVTSSLSVSATPAEVVVDATPVSGRTITGVTWVNSTTGGSGSFEYVSGVSWSGPIALNEGANSIIITAAQSDSETAEATPTITLSSAPITGRSQAAGNSGAVYQVSNFGTVRTIGN